MKNIYFIILSILVIIYIVHEVMKRKFSIAESFLWIIGCIIMLILSIWPHIIDWFAIKLNIAYPPSLFFVICIVFLILMLFRDSKRIASQNEKIIELEQHVANLEFENKKKK